MPLPPYFVRMIPGIGMALTGVYVGWKIYEHVQEQNKRAEKENLVGLQKPKPAHVDSNENEFDDASINRTQLCNWMGLPLDALDVVSNSNMPIVLEAISLIPQQARTAFLEVYCTKFNHQEYPAQMIREWIDIFEKMTDKEENGQLLIEQCVVLLTQVQLPNLQVFAVSLSQALRHDQEEGSQSPFQKIPTLLNHFYILWNMDSLDFILEQLWMRYSLRSEGNDHPGMVPFEELLQILMSISGDDSSQDLKLLVQNWKRLPGSEGGGMSRVNGYLTSLQLVADGEQDSMSVSQLLHKYASLSQARFLQVTMCCAKFAKPQAKELLRTLLSSYSVDSKTAAASPHHESDNASRTSSSSSSSSHSSSLTSSLLSSNELQESRNMQNDFNLISLTSSMQQLYHNKQE
eukprot:CAMPEP_0172450934 /NCGR_PEP_ID=MMETSP1065-20121228/9117_1 /TAXON_ID=265537 /ORGANISM="Amphiprora paludosa, Strain CCMP125" /LENGTH=403 /DNA_ID=CAMNT_0013202787 /DNA_START=15 /DNA_END=1226 /DNA_ORIENTATION=+